MVWTVSVEGRRRQEYRVQRWTKNGRDRLYVDRVIRSPRREWTEAEGYYDLNTGQMVWTRRQTNPDLTAQLLAEVERIAREIRAADAALADPDVA